MVKPPRKGTRELRRQITQALSNAADRFRNRLPLALTAGAVVGGMALVVPGANGSRWTELGVALSSTGALGLLLLWAERALAAKSDQIDKRVSLTAAPPPATDSVEDPEQPPKPRQAAVRDSEAKGHVFTVEYEGWLTDTSRIDADQVRLRAFRDGQYFQFFVGIVPGVAFRPALRGASSVTFSQFKRSTAVVTAEHIIRHLAAGQQPLDDPSRAFEIFPDVDEAARRARAADDAEPEMGELIARWEESSGSAPGGHGGDGGGGSIVGDRGTVVGGHGGDSGSGGIGGDGGSGFVHGDDGLIIGGDGGSAGTADGRGGRAARSPIERGGRSPRLWHHGRGGSGSNAPEFDRRLAILTALRLEYLQQFPDQAPYVEAGLDAVPAKWINARLAEEGEHWEVSEASGYRLPPL